MFYLSGKGYNDYGKYQDCVESQDFNYLFAFVHTKDKLPIPFGIGLCVPKVCKPVDLNELKPYLIGGINNYLPVVFNSTKGFNLTDVLLTAEDITIDETTNLNQEYSRVTLINGLFIAIMVFYVLATILASIVTHYRFKARKNKNKGTDADKSATSEQQDMKILDAPNPDEGARCF